MPAAGMPSPIDSNRPSPGGAADMSPSTLAATQVRSPAPGASNSRASMMRPSSAAGLGRSSVFARPSMLLGGRPSVVTDMSNVFAEAKIHDAHLEIFETDVVMEGELSKKGESGLQTWKNRMFVLRGQELSYYTPDNKSKQRYGVLKGSMNVRGAVVERVDNLSFSIALDDAVASSSSANAPRVLAAPTVQALFDWMTAISIASEAHPIPPPEAGLSLVDHSRTTHVILVRHGHYATSQTPSDDLNGPLTELGVRQARATGKFVYDYLNARMVTKRFPQGFPIVHSGVRRSVETAKYMAEAFSSPNAIELRENKLFREAWPGNPLPNSNRKMLAREKLDNMVSDCARLKVAYRTFFRHLIPTDLRDQQRERKLTEAEVEQFMATIGARGSTQSRLHDRYRVVVCHANIIRWFVCKAMGVDPDGSWGRMRHNHAAITTLEIDSVGNVQVATVNSTGHLSTDLLSEA